MGTGWERLSHRQPASIRRPNSSVLPTMAFRVANFGGVTRTHRPPYGVFLPAWEALNRMKRCTQSCLCGRSMHTAETIWGSRETHESSSRFPITQLRTITQLSVSLVQAAKRLVEIEGGVMPSVTSSSFDGCGVQMHSNPACCSRLTSLRGQAVLGNKSEAQLT